jgi:small subunit ribosomal protein S3
MGQKVSPIGFRTGVTIGWKSRWFAPKSNFGEFLVEDEKIRRFINRRLNQQPPHAGISEIQIERTREEVKVQLKTARPGLVIGPKGAEVERLKGDLEELTDRRVNINIVEVRHPDLDAQLVAEGISEQLKRRGSFRRTLKQRADSSMQAGAKGIKIGVAGRLGGADMSRREMVIRGSIPLHTLEADVDYGFVHCFTSYGAIGVKVWIYRGKFGDQPSEEEAAAREQQPVSRARRRRERGGSGGSGGPGRSGGGRGRGGGRGGRRERPGPRGHRGAPTPQQQSKGGESQASQPAESDQNKPSEATPEPKNEGQAPASPPADSAGGETQSNNDNSGSES